MKIAILSSIYSQTPPLRYGPAEQIASNIAEGLVEKGLDVTLFATGNSVTEGKLSSVCEFPHDEDPSVDPRVAECLHIGHLMEQADNFDLIQNIFGFLPLPWSGLIKIPMVTTIQSYLSSRIIPVYKKYNSSGHYVSVSNATRNPELDYIATVYNGININEFIFSREPEDYLLFMGIIHPENGTYEAIDIAIKSKRKLIIAGFVQDQVYFDHKVKPYINNEDILYAGNPYFNDKLKLLSQACALLYPVALPSFELSVIEAMACGTPVIAFRQGSMNEFILHEKTGFLVSNADEAISAVLNISSINRSHCTRWITSMFSRQKMTEGYLKVYNKILG
jgi:glycosyltransferase involved in cell wall biosynthesis